jgi:hypothetical protein
MSGIYDTMITNTTKRIIIQNGLMDSIHMYYYYTIIHFYTCIFSLAYNPGAMGAHAAYFVVVPLAASRRSFVIRPADF